MSYVLTCRPTAWKGTHVSTCLRSCRLCLCGLVFKLYNYPFCSCVIVLYLHLEAYRHHGPDSVFQSPALPPYWHKAFANYGGLIIFDGRMISKMGSRAKSQDHVGFLIWSTRTKGRFPDISGQNPVLSHPLSSDAPFHVNMAHGQSKGRYPLSLSRLLNPLEDDERRFAVAECDDVASPVNPNFIPRAPIWSPLSPSSGTRSSSYDDPDSPSEFERQQRRASKARVTTPAKVESPTEPELGPGSSSGTYYMFVHQDLQGSR